MGKLDKATAVELLLLDQPDLFDEMLEADGIDEAVRVETIEAWQDAAALRLGLGTDWYEREES